MRDMHWPPLFPEMSVAERIRQREEEEVRRHIMDELRAASLPSGHHYHHVPQPPPTQRRWWQDITFEEVLPGLIVLCVLALVVALALGDSHSKSIRRHCAAQGAVMVNIDHVHHCAPLSSLTVIPDSLQ